MEYIGKYFVEEGSPDDYGEAIKFFHPKFPEWRVIIEPRREFRDAMGNARGIQNPDTALTVQFAGKMLVTNSTRTIKGLRGMEKYRGKKSPAYVARLKAEGSRGGGFIEVDPLEEQLLIEREKMEQEIRARLEAERDAKEAGIEPQTEIIHEDKPDEQLMLVEEEVQPGTVVAGKFCPNCGKPAASKFCPGCGTALTARPMSEPMPEPKPKKTWKCDQCEMEFSSGFKLGDHKKKVHVVREDTSVEMIAGGHGTGNIGGVL